MPTTFVTAAQAEKQVTSHQARLGNAHTFGEGRYLLDGLELTMETSNRLKAGAGVMLLDGSYVTVDEAGQEWTVENGTQAMKRIDLAGYEYSVGEDGMESLAPKVLKGTPHATAPAIPTYAKGSLLDRPAKLFVPVAKVELDGISAKPPTCVLDTLPTIAGLRDSVSQRAFTDYMRSDDLNDHESGVVRFGESTKNRPPSTKPYGACIAISVPEGPWGFQMAFPLGGAPSWRRRDVDGAWSPWWRFTTD